MKHPSEITHCAGTEYVAPALRTIPLLEEHAVCASPIPGGNEDIGYEDWD